MAFADPFALADYLQIGEADLNVPAALLALDLASATVRSYTGQLLSRVADDTVTLVGSGGWLLLLPETPVAGVSAVTVDAEPVAADGFRWDAYGRLSLRPRTMWPFDSDVAVTYTHGFDPVPDDIRAVTIQAASRAFTNPEGVRSEGIGSYSTTYTVLASGSALGVVLSPEEQSVLDRYKL